MNKTIRIFGLLLTLCGLLTSLALVQTGNAQGIKGFDGSILLGCPTNSSMTVTVTANTAQTVFVEWGETEEALLRKSAETQASPEAPAVIVMDNLLPEKTYYYRVNYRDNDSAFAKTETFSFHTPRETGSSYSFLVQSDSHLLNKADQDLYQENMEQMASLNPDFFFSLGDDFLNDQTKSDPRHQNLETLRKTYMQQLPFLSTVGRSAPFFYTIGNHEGEYGNFLDGTDQNLTVMATKLRKTYYQNPVPNEFYSGNTEQEAFCGAPENYYAFTWGDALYVSIDPYRYTTADPYEIKSGWDWTLGKTQYDWLRKTLETSHAKYKFVFAHHAIGNNRGGAQLARLYEWGGYDQKGSYQFDQMRPGWGKPIQQIFKDSGVTIFFQGHDHLFAREVVDGVVYQTIPKPAETEADIQSNGDAYPNADKLVNSGFLKVDVSASAVTVHYYRTHCMLDGADQSKTSGLVYQYTVDENHVVKVLTGRSDDFGQYGGGNTQNSHPGQDSGGKEKEPKDKQSKDKTISIILNGKKMSFESKPFIDANGRTQVPLRFLAEKMGAAVTWQPNGETNAVQIQMGKDTILLKLGDHEVLVNGQEKTLDTVPFLKDGKTFVPIRLIAEAFGATVSWDGKSKTISIRTEAAQSGSVTESSSVLPVPEGGFSFAIEADPHFDEQTSDSILKQSMENIVSLQPSFLIDLGDASMAEKLCKTEDEVKARYAMLRDYFAPLGDIPLYLVNGNHDGETGFYGSNGQMLNWTRSQRLSGFPVPFAGTEGFSGNVTTANYYTFTKGNAQFIILDPYTYSTEKAGEGGNWASTLGREQYDWLKNVLASSQSAYKFVFVHNLLGGVGKDQRGGAEAAAFYEWGGRNENGVDEFSKMRPGWDMPIHDLLVQYHVNAVFHGHDHFYAKQEKDGIIYQLVPQPGTPGNSVLDAEKYSYTSGTCLPSPGYLRVVVSDAGVVVEYINPQALGETERVTASYLIK